MKLDKIINNIMLVGESLIYWNNKVQFVFYIKCKPSKGYIYSTLSKLNTIQ